jgi:hypothetical protein
MVQDSSPTNYKKEPPKKYSREDAIKDFDVSREDSAWVRGNLRYSLYSILFPLECLREKYRGLFGKVSYYPRKKQRKDFIKEERKKLSEKVS